MPEGGGHGARGGHGVPRREEGRRRVRRRGSLTVEGVRKAGTPGIPAQRMPLEIVPAISSTAWITLEFISNERWAVIRLVISLTGSTFDPSR